MKDSGMAQEIEQRGVVQTWKLMLGSRGFFWLTFSFLIGLGLVFVEYGVSVFLQFFLTKLGMSHTTHMPPWLVHLIQEISLNQALLLLIALGLVRSLSYFSGEWCAGLVQELASARLRFLVAHRLLFVPTKHQQLDASSVSHYMGEIIPNTARYFFHLINCIVYFTLIMLLSLCMFLLLPREAAVSLVGLGMIGFLISVFQRIVRTRSSVLPTHYKTLQRSIERIARNRLFVRISRSEDIEYRGLQHSIHGYFSKSVQAIFFSACSTNLAPFLGILLLTLLIFLSQSVFHSSGVKLLAFLYLFVRFIQQIKLFAWYYNEAGKLWPRYQQAVQLFWQQTNAELDQGMRPYEELRIWQEPKILSVSSQNQVPLHKDLHPPRLEVRDISFRYTEDSKVLFKKLSFVVESGQHIGIVGKSGAGKSTLLALIFGLFAPTKGEILWDSISATTFFEQSSVAVGYVGPEPFTRYGTIRENLCYGLSDDVSDDAIWRALQQAQLDDTIRGLGGQLDYVLEEDGTGLSAGEKQRLSLARALLRKPTLLVLDEASANLDVETESRLVEVIAGLKGRCTTLIVSHRPMMLKYVDLQLELVAEQENKDC